jgi:hypothetical protein
MCSIFIRKVTFWRKIRKMSNFDPMGAAEDITQIKNFFHFSSPTQGTCFGCYYISILQISFLSFHPNMGALHTNRAVIIIVILDSVCSFKMTNLDRVQSIHFALVLIYRCSSVLSSH